MTTRRERLEAKLEKREEWAAKAETRSTEALNAAHNTGKDIPLGQPNVEGRMTGVYNRIARNMDKGCAQHRLAGHHHERAAGLAKQLEKTIFSDDEDAVDRIEAKIAELEAQQAHHKETNKVCRSTKLTGAEKHGLLHKHGYADAAIDIMLHPQYSFEKPGIASFTLTNLAANIRRYKERLEQIKRRQARAARAEAAPGGVMIEAAGTIYCRITFADKPERPVIESLKLAGFYWSNGCWFGKADAVPAEVRAMMAEEGGE